MKINKTALTFSMALCLAAAGTGISYAEEAAAPAVAATKASASAAEVVAHLEKGIADTSQSDFSNANLAIRAARASLETLTGDAEILKQADAVIQRGQVANKSGDVAKATAALNEGIKLIKSL